MGCQDRSSYRPSENLRRTVTTRVLIHHPPSQTPIPAIIRIGVIIARKHLGSARWIILLLVLTVGRSLEKHQKMIGIKLKSLLKISDLNQLKTHLKMRVESKSNYRSNHLLRRPKIRGVARKLFGGIKVLGV